MGKKREAVTSIPGPGNPGTNDRMPPVRGTDSTVTISDLPRSSGLPGVSADNPDRTSQEVPTVPEKVARRDVTAHEAEMTLDEKISILNALRSIRNKVPKVKDPKIQDLIRTLYVKWIDETIIEILGSPGKSTSVFAPQEVDALKVLAQTILRRQQGSVGAPAPAPMVPRAGANPIDSKPGLDPGINSEKFRQAQAAFLQELGKMEREGPSY